MSLVAKFAQAAARNTTTYTAWMANPRWISRQKMGSRKKSIHASQYRVGRYGWMALAAFSVTSTSLATSAARDPIAAPIAESVSVDRKSAIAATPSIETVMNAMAPRTRSTRSRVVSGVPDSDVMAAPGCSPAVGAPPAPGAIEPEIPPGGVPTADARDGPRISTPVAYAPGWSPSAGRPAMIMGRYRA